MMLALQCSFIGFGAAMIVRQGTNIVALPHANIVGQSSPAIQSRFALHTPQPPGAARAHASRLALLEPPPPKGFVWSSIRPTNTLEKATATEEHTDGHLWDAGSAADGSFQDFERECFGDEDGCDFWFYGGPSPWAGAEMPTDQAHVDRVAQIRAEGLAAVKTRQMREQQQKDAMQRLLALRDA